MSTISVIIPVKNGQATLAACLSSIKNQNVDVAEIIVLDSASTDDSRNIAKSFGAKIIDIKPGTFNHGETRNVGARAAIGDLLYFTVQDSRIASNDMLGKMLSHFNDEEVQAVNGIQGIPSELDKNPAVWFVRYSKPVPEIRWFGNNSFEKLTPRQQLEFCRWDNVNAMYRRKALISLPFRAVNFSEDMLWSSDALHKGYKIIRDSSLLVYHYHNHDFKYTFQVIYIINYGQLLYFQSLPVLPNIFKAIAQNTFAIFKKPGIGFFKKLYWVWHNIVRHFAHFSSALVFRTFNLMGIKGIEKGLRLFCAEVPQGRQKNNLITKTNQPANKHAPTVS